MLFHPHVLHVFLIGDVASAHRLEVWGLKLAVNHHTTVFAHNVGQANKGNFAAVGDEREHALAEEAPAERHAVQSTDQPVALPYLYALGKTLTVEFGEGFYHVLSKPCSPFLDPQFGTVVYHLVETLAYANVVFSLPHQCAHRVRDVYFLGKDDKAVHRAVPVYFLAASEVIPWKDAVAVGQYQTVYRQVAADGEKAVGLNSDGVGKYKSFV